MSSFTASALSSCGLWHEQLSAARVVTGTLKAYTKADLLILDEWLLRPMNQEWSYELLELVEARTKHGSTIFCTQYDPEEWYPRLSPEQDSPIADAVMDRIVHNAHVVSIEGSISMRERHGLAAAETDGKHGEQP